MQFRSLLVFVVVAFGGLAVAAQNDLQITKKVSRTVPGMEQATAGMPPALASQIKELSSSVATVYVKGSSMRTDNTLKVPKMTGGFETHTFSTVVQCDRQRLTNFDTKSKKYYEYTLEDPSSSDRKFSSAGGYVTVTGKVTDTGERSTLFGYNARRFRQTMVFTPSQNACQKQTFQLEIDGWYADIPGFSCPLRTASPENTGDSDCADDVDYRVEGVVKGVALKEVKKVTMAGQTVTVDEEATALKKVDLLDSLFETPAGYKAGKTVTRTSGNSLPANMPDPGRANEATDTVANAAVSLPLPAAGLVQQPPLGKKNAGMIRIGIAKPKITTPESKRDPNAGADIGDAVAKALVANLNAQNVEAVLLDTDLTENECRQKECDYIFYADVTQKRGGGGMFGKMLAMGAMSAVGGLVPGIGGIVAATAGNVLMGQTMGKAAKAKDEFTFAYKVSEPGAGSVLTEALTKAKAKEDGEDVLTPQIKQASAGVLAEIGKKAGR